MEQPVFEYAADCLNVTATGDIEIKLQNANKDAEYSIDVISGAENPPAKSPWMKLDDKDVLHHTYKFGPGVKYKFLVMASLPTVDTNDAKDDIIKEANPAIPEAPALEVEVPDGTVVTKKQTNYCAVLPKTFEIVNRSYIASWIMNPMLITTTFDFKHHCVTCNQEFSTNYCGDCGFQNPNLADIIAALKTK